MGVFFIYLSQQVSAKKKRSTSFKKDAFYDGILSHSDDSVSVVFQMKFTASCLITVVHTQ